MHLRWSAAPPAALIALLTCTGVARAENDEAATEDGFEEFQAKREDASARYMAGVAAYQEGRFTDAIELFLQADTLAPSPALSFNIARAYEKIGDSSNTLRWYRDYLRREPEAEDKDVVSQLIDEYQTVLREKGVQQLTVLSDPPGATMSINGTPLGVTPWTGDLAPGPYTLSLTRTGYARREEAIELRPEAAVDVSVRLVPATETSAPPPRATSDPHTPNPTMPAASPQLTDAGTGEATSGTGIWPYVALGAGAMGLGAALGFEFARRSAEDDAQKAPDQVTYKDKLDLMDRHQVTARILTGVGAALTLTGGVLLVIDLSAGPKETQTALACQSDGCWLTARGRF